MFFIMKKLVSFLVYVFCLTVCLVSFLNYGNLTEGTTLTTLLSLLLLAIYRHK